MLPTAVVLALGVAHDTVPTDLVPRLPQCVNLLHLHLHLHLARYCAYLRQLQMSTPCST